MENNPKIFQSLWKQQSNSETHIVTGILVLCLGIFLILLLFAHRSAYVFQREAAVIATTTPTTNPQLKVDIEAQAAYILDIRNDRVLYQKNARVDMPLASITKIMTAIVAREAFSKETVVTIHRPVGQLSAGEQWPLNELLEYILVTSSNEASAAIADFYNLHRAPQDPADFTAALNAKAQALGLTMMHFYNETGLDISIAEHKTNSGSARDVAILFKYAMEPIPDILDQTRNFSTQVASASQIHEINNTNEIINKIPWAVGSKTGFTDLAGGNLVISYDTSIGRSVIIVVLGSSREGRFTDMQKLISATQEFLTKESH